MELENFECGLFLEIPDIGLSIKGFDADYVIQKSNSLQPDIAQVVLWNFDDESYHNLISQNYKVNVFSAYSKNPKQLVFTGYIDFNTVKRCVCECRSKAFPDTYTQLKFIDSKPLFDEAYINKDYREPVSAGQILADCAEAMGAENIVVDTSINNKIYKSFKAIGKPHNIISDICNSIGTSANILDEVVYVGDSSKIDIPLEIHDLNLTNSMEPFVQNANEILIISEFNPQINSNDFVRCNFTYFQGIYPIKSIYSYGDTYSTVGVTKIVIGI